MKRRVLLLPVCVLSLALVLFMEGGFEARANPGYTFVAPTAISLGTMIPRPSPYLASSSGNLTGDNPTGYSLTATDAKALNRGHMVSGSNMLNSKLKIGKDAGSLADSDGTVTLLSTSSVTDALVPLCVSQVIGASDNVASGYAITVTYTVAAK